MTDKNSAPGPVSGSGRLAGKVAAITGGSSGFGEAAALLFVQEGARVVIGDIQDDAGRRVAESLGCLLYTSPSPRDRQKSRMPSSA